MITKQKLLIMFGFVLMFSLIGSIIGTVSAGQATYVVQNINSTKEPPFTPPSSGHTPPSGITMTPGQGKSNMGTNKAQFEINAQGQIPYYRWGNPANDTMNIVRIMKLIEYKDTIGNGMYQPNETVQQMELQGNANWSYSQAA